MCDVSRKKKSILLRIKKQSQIERINRKCFPSKNLSMASRIMAPELYYYVLKPFYNETKEHLIVSTLDGEYKIIETRVISIGTLNRTLVHPREVFRDAILDNASAIMMAHNHPSGNIEPSREDRQVTQRIVEAGLTIGIHLLDHVIFTKNDYFSFLDNSEI